jgi:carbon starvation protein CstA
MGKAVKEASQKKKLSIFAAVAMIVLVVVSLARQLLNDIEGPWVWIGVVVQAVALIVLITCLIRFVRIQRDDYWSERGRDPRNPDRPIS